MTVDDVISDLCHSLPAERCQKGGPYGEPGDREASRAHLLKVTENPETNERRYRCTACDTEFMVPLDDAALPTERECDGCHRYLRTDLTQPKDTHLSGDGERLEESDYPQNWAYNLPEWLEIYAEWMESGRPIEDTNRLLMASTLRAAQRVVQSGPPFAEPSPENSSGVEEGAPPSPKLLLSSLRWAVGWIDDHGPFGAEMPAGDASDWLEWAAAHDLLKDADAASTQPVSPQPDPTTRLSEGTGESERTRLWDALRLLAITHFDNERLITDEEFDCTDLFDSGLVRHVELGQTGEKECQLTTEGMEAIQEALDLDLSPESRLSMEGGEEELRERLLSAFSLRALAKHRHDAEHALGFDDRAWDDLSITRQVIAMNHAQADLVAALDAATTHKPQAEGGDASAVGPTDVGRNSTRVAGAGNADRVPGPTKPQDEMSRCVGCSARLASAHKLDCPRLIGEERGTVMFADCQPQDEEER